MPHDDGIEMMADRMQVMRCESCHRLHIRLCSGEAFIEGDLTRESIEELIPVLVEELFNLIIEEKG
jgi:hypothetical protein